MSSRQHGHAGQDHACRIPHYDVRDLIIREDIMAKTKELAELITTSAEVEFYKEAEKRIQNHREVQDLIKLIKKKQKEIVAFEHTFKNPAMVKKIEQEIEDLQDKLDEFPIVNQFKQAQDDLNQLLQMIVSVIRDTVSEKISVESAVTQPEISNCSD